VRSSEEDCDLVEARYSQCEYGILTDLRVNRDTVGESCSASMCVCVWSSGEL